MLFSIAVEFVKCREVLGWGIGGEQGGKGDQDEMHVLRGERKRSQRVIEMRRD